MQQEFYHLYRRYVHFWTGKRSPGFQDCDETCQALFTEGFLSILETCIYQPGEELYHSDYQVNEMTFLVEGRVAVSFLPFQKKQGVKT